MIDQQSVGRRDDDYWSRDSAGALATADANGPGLSDTDDDIDDDDDEFQPGEISGMDDNLNEHHGLIGTEALEGDEDEDDPDADA